MDTTRYQSPFSERYASPQMQYLFSADKKFTTWRRLWVALARAQMKLGLPVTQEQIDELEAHRDTVNYDDAVRRERECRHDVMSHIYAYGLQCPGAKGIIHLGATSCYVGDNTDLIIMREALCIIRDKLAGVMAELADFAQRYKSLPALAYTHLQPAQLTTVGKRATLWLHDLYLDYGEIVRLIESLKLRGAKGTTGTQASFLELFDEDDGKVDEMERLIAEEMGFDGVYPVTGQTYPRKIDSLVLNALSGLAQSASKFSCDLRLLAQFKEMEEPFEAEQVGSSAMPYKRNPMRSERITSLSRLVISNAANPAVTAATQWLERTLDDSANRRVAVAEAFLAVDGILNLMRSICGGMVVYPKVIEQRVRRELPFMATENIMMNAVKNGGDRQKLHERLRAHSLEAAKTVKELGLENDLVERICADPAFRMSREELESALEPSLYIGRSVRQVEDFLAEHVEPILAEHPETAASRPDISV